MTDEDYEQTFNDFWADIVLNGDEPELDEMIRLYGEHCRAERARGES